MVRGVKKADRLHPFKLHLRSSICWAPQLMIEYRLINAGELGQERVTFGRGSDTACSGVQLLIASSRSCSESVNLQHGDWRRVLLDLVPIKQILQIAGLVCSLGQRETPIIDILVLDGSADAVTWARFICAYRAQLSSNTDLDVMADADHDDVNTFGQPNTDMLSRTADKKGAQEAAVKNLRPALLDKAIRDRLNIRDDAFILMGLTQEPWLKALLPGEMIYRLYHGGDAAKEAFFLYSLCRGDFDSNEAKKTKAREEEIVKYVERMRAFDDNGGAGLRIHRLTREVDNHKMAEIVLGCACNIRRCHPLATAYDKDVVDVLESYAKMFSSGPRLITMALEMWTTKPDFKRLASGN